MKDKLKRGLWLGFIIVISALLIINGFLVEEAGLINKIMTLLAALVGIVLCFMIPNVIKCSYDDIIDINNKLLQKLKYIVFFLRVGFSVISVVISLILTRQALLEEGNIHFVIIIYSWLIPFFGALMYYIPWFIFKFIQYTIISIVWFGLSCYGYVLYDRFDVPDFVKIKRRYFDDETVTKVWLDSKFYDVIKRLDKN